MKVCIYAALSALFVLILGGAPASADESIPAESDGCASVGVTQTDAREGPVRDVWMKGGQRTSEGYACAPAVAECLAANPGAVTADAARDDVNDLVCVGTGQSIFPTTGDDTYLWALDAFTSSTYLWQEGGAQALDAGFDSLSLDEWAVGFTDAVNGPWAYTNTHSQNIERLVLTAFGDAIGTDDQTCAPGASNLIVETGDGDDDLRCIGGVRVDTGAGNDTIEHVTTAGAVVTGPDADVVRNVTAGGSVATDGGDDLIEHVSASTVNGGEGADTIRYVTDGATVYGATGDDVIVDADASTVFAGIGDDVIRGVDSGSTAYAGSGSDLVVGDSGSDAIVLGSGEDVARVSGDGADTVLGGAGDDVVYESGRDTVRSADAR